MSETRERVNRFFDAADQLRGFPNSEDLALFLKGLNYKGRRNGSSCPVALFVKDCVGDPDAEIHVSAFDVQYVMKGQGKYDVIALSISGTPVAAFVEAFDHKEYPDLIGPEPAMVKA